MVTFALKHRRIVGQAKAAGGHAAHHIVLLLRRLGQLVKCELNTLRWRLFKRAAVWSRKSGKPTLKLAVQGEQMRAWWQRILEKTTAPPNCNSVESLQA